MTWNARTVRRTATCALMVCAVLVGGAPPARANGAFPDEFSVHFPPNAPHRILIGANFGLLVSEDDGATWRYACEPWVVSGSNAALAALERIDRQPVDRGHLRRPERRRAGAGDPPVRERQQRHRRVARRREDVR